MALSRFSCRWLLQGAASRARRLGPVLALFWLCLPLLRAQLPEHAEKIVDYDIQVTLDAAQKSLKGSETVQWRNPGKEPVGDLWFHLYLNAFKNNRTTFFRESGGQLRGFLYSEGKWGWIKIRSLKLSDGTDLTGALEFEQPDDGNPDDQTVARVELPTPVEAGKTLQFKIEFDAQLPRVFARTGYYQNFFLVGQWFPKLGVYEPAGMRGRETAGWNCHQFHADSEFYADYGHYRVQMTVPKNYVVGATGKRMSRRDKPDGTSTYLYEQGDVHDFAWTASPEFREVRRDFSADRDVSAEEYAAVAREVGKSPADIHLRDVNIIVLMQPSHVNQTERFVRSVKESLKWFGLWFGRYPYSTLTLVDPPTEAAGAGGMEYPTFITGGTTYGLSVYPFTGFLLPEIVTAHEMAHQWWYGLVGNNEFEEAWLDEGFADYSTGRLMARLYGTQGNAVDMPGLRVGYLEMARMQNTPSRLYDAIDQPAWTYFGSYPFYTYAKPQLALATMENLLTTPVMLRVLRTYQEQWRFRHPSTDDFQRVAEEVSGRNLTSFFDQVIKGKGILDYEVATVLSRPERQPQGIFPKTEKVDAPGVEGKTENNDTPGAEDKPEGSPETDSKDSGKTEPTFRSEVEVCRNGDVHLPVDIVIYFEHAKPVVKHWDGESRWVRYRFTGPHRVLKATVDPQHKLQLDVNFLNNSRRVKSDARASVLWSTRLLFWFQNLFAGAGLLAW